MGSWGVLFSQMSFAHQTQNTMYYTTTIFEETYKGALKFSNYSLRAEFILLFILIFLVYVIRKATYTAFAERGVRLGWLSSDWLKPGKLSGRSIKKLDRDIFLNFDTVKYYKVADGKYRSSLTTLSLLTLFFSIVNHTILCCFVEYKALYYIITFIFAGFVHDCHAAVGYHYWIWFYILFPWQFYFFSFLVYRSGIFQHDLFILSDQILDYKDMLVMVYKGRSFQQYYRANLAGIKAASIANIGAFAQWLYNSEKDQFSFLMLASTFTFSFKEFIDQKEFTNFFFYGMTAIFGETDVLSKLQKDNLACIFEAQGGKDKGYSNKTRSVVSEVNQYLLLLRNLAGMKDLVFNLKKWFLGFLLSEEQNEDYCLRVLFPEFKTFFKLHEIFEVIDEDQLSGDKELQDLFVKYIARKRKLDKLLLTDVDKEYKQTLFKMRDDAGRRIQSLKAYKDTSNGFRQEPVSIVIEGPSGIGKTTYLVPALSSLIFHDFEEYDFCEDNGNFRYNNDFVALKTTDKSFTADDLWRLQYNVNSSVGNIPFAEFLEIHNTAHFLMNKPKISDKDAKLLAKVHTYVFNEIPRPPHVAKAQVAIINRMHTLKVYMHPKWLTPKSGKEKEYSTRLSNFNETIKELNWFARNCLTPRGERIGETLKLQDLPEEVRCEKMIKHYSDLSNYLFFVGHKHSAWKNPCNGEAPLIDAPAEPNAGSNLFAFDYSGYKKLELHQVIKHLRGKFKENRDDCLRANQGREQRKMYGLLPDSLDVLVKEINQLESEEKKNPSLKTGDLMKMAKPWLPSLAPVKEDEVEEVIKSQGGLDFDSYKTDTVENEVTPTSRHPKYSIDPEVKAIIEDYRTVGTRPFHDYDFYFYGESDDDDSVGIFFRASEERITYGLKSDFRFLYQDNKLLQTKAVRDYFLNEKNYYESQLYMCTCPDFVREVENMRSDDLVRSLPSRTWMQCAKDLLNEVKHLKIDNKWKMFFPVFIILVVIMVLLYMIYKNKSLTSNVCNHIYKDKRQIVNRFCYKDKKEETEQEADPEYLYVAQGVNSTKEEFDRSMSNRTLPTGNQATSEVVGKVAENNQLVVEVPSKDGKRFIFCGNALAVRDRLLVICAHFVIDVDKFYLSQCQKDRVEVKLSECEVVNDSFQTSDDLMLLKLPVTFPFSFKNITNMIATKVDAEPLPSVTLLNIWGNNRKHLIVLNNLNNCAVRTDEFQYVCNKDEKHILSLKRFIHYDTQSCEGMCGSVIFGTHGPNYNKIIGIHVAGCENLTGQAAIITQTDVNVVTSQGAVEESPFIIGDGPKIPMVYKSPITKSIFYTTIKGMREYRPLTWQEKTVQNGEVVEKERSISEFPTKFPAPIRPKMIDGEASHPLDIRFGKFRVNPEFVFDESAIQSVRCDMMFHKNLEEYPIKYDIGFFGDGKLMKPLDRQTSTGYFGLLDSNEKRRKRSYWLPFMDDQGKIHDGAGTHELTLKLDEMYEKLSLGTMEIVFVVHPKADECLPLQKIVENNARGIYAGPLDVLVMCRALFYDLQAWVVKNKIKNDYAIGMNPYGRDWSNLVTKLTRAPKSKADLVFMDVDVKTQEIVMYQKRFKEEMFDIVMSFYANCPEKDNIVRLNMLKSVFNHNKLLYDGLFYGGMDLNPSGHPLTALINSLATIWWHRYIYYTVVHKHKGETFNYWNSKFDDHVNLVAMGDDMICGVDTSITNFYHPKNVRKEFNNYGIDITPAEKDSDLIFKKDLSECTFLKRHFGVAGDGYPVGLLVRDSILNSIFWCKNRDHVISSSGQNATSLLFEASLHGRELYKYIYEIIETREKGKFSDGNLLDLNAYKLSYAECMQYRKYHLSGIKAFKQCVGFEKYTYF
jgi:hypothetical protein